MDIINPQLLQAAQDELAHIDPVSLLIHDVLRRVLYFCIVYLLQFMSPNPKQEQMKMNEDHDEGAADHNKTTAALGEC